MKTYRCKNCGEEIEVDDTVYFVCPNCGYEEKNDETNELDSIIDSVIEDILEEKKSKITSNNKYIEISNDNSIISRNAEKCNSCGNCKKVCENIANITYDLNACKKPICTSCGACVLSCPTGALSFKQSYKEVKRIINLNEKIVVAIVDPSVYSYLFNIASSVNDVETKLVGALKEVGFDYVFNGAFASDLNILEEVTEFAERIKNKQLVPMFTSSCPSWINYTQIYHPEILKNISSCKTPMQMHSAIIKDYFSKEKGFEPSKIITVGISTCTSQKEDYNDKLNLDYSLTLYELTTLLKEEEISLDNVTPLNYDEMFSEGSGSAYLRSICGGESESFVRTFCRIMKKAKLKESELELYDLRDVKGIKETTIKVGDYPLRIAIVEGLVNFEKLMNNQRYRHYHIIEVMNCVGGCIGGSGRLYNENNINLNIDKIYKKDKESAKRCAHDNKEIKSLYKNYLSKPLSAKCLETLHRGYLDKSNMLKDK